MGDNSINTSPDPSQMSMKQKLQFFEKSSENQGIQGQINNFNSFYGRTTKKRYEAPTSDKNTSTSNIINATNYTSTPLSSAAYSFRRTTNAVRAPNNNNSSQNIKSLVSNVPSSSTLSTNFSSLPYNHSNFSLKPLTESAIKMKEVHDVFRDLDSFIEKELNDIQVRKRIGVVDKNDIIKEIRERDGIYEDKILDTLKKLKDEVHEIRENQKEFENKMRKHELSQIYQRKKIEYDNNVKTLNNVVKEHKFNPVVEKEKTELHYSEIETVPKKNVPAKFPPKVSEKESAKSLSTASSNSSIIAESGFSRAERIRKLESEIFKEETLMMKINRVLESIKAVDDRNLQDIVNIERHYLVASVRFQSALSELRKLNETCEIVPHLPPFNRKGKLYVRDIMLEVKSSYFQRALVTKNDYVLAMMKYEDKIFATKPIRITDDVRIIKFSEKFSIPEIFMDFDMRLEIYGTTFWRKNSSVRETMLKKYGFVTFSLCDTGNRSKRFTLVEVLQSDNVPIRSKVLMKISQKITTDIQYKGILFIKLRDMWHETSAHLNGHLLEFTFKKTINGITRSQETMLLDLYNIDNDSIIPVDSHRVSDKPFTFVLKFNHYVDVANFYVMIAAENEETYAEWTSAINKVLVLIK